MHCVQSFHPKPRLLYWKHLAFEYFKPGLWSQWVFSVSLCLEYTKLPFAAVDLCCEPDKNISLVEWKRLEDFQVQKSVLLHCGTKHSNTAKQIDANRKFWSSVGYIYQLLSIITQTFVCNVTTLVIICQIISTDRIYVVCWLMGTCISL